MDLNSVLNNTRLVMMPLMDQPEYYEWWVDTIQDCLCQIAGRFVEMNPKSNACWHVCDETYTDLDNSIGVIEKNSFNDIPSAEWKLIVELTKVDNFETAAARTKANIVLDSEYFRYRERWSYCVS